MDRDPVLEPRRQIPPEHARIAISISTLLLTPADRPSPSRFQKSSAATT